MSKQINSRLQNKIDTTENWESNNPVLLNGEIGIEKLSDGNKKIKIGDGENSWSNLPYVEGDSSASSDEFVTLDTTQTIAGAKTFNEILVGKKGLQITGNISSTGTITGSKVYNAVWNDYAEWFEKEEKLEEFEPGDICVWDINGVTKSSKPNDRLVVGVVSDTYGHILGGEQLENMEDNNKNYVPIGLIGRVKVKVKGPVKKGDLIVSSSEVGVGIVDNNANVGEIVGKALEDSNLEAIKRIIVLI